MKKFIIFPTLAMAVLTPFVLAECNSPYYPTCPLSTSLRATIFIDVWTCCDQTRACPWDGTKYPRFERRQSMAEYFGTDGQWHYCVTGLQQDGPDIGCCD